MKVYNLIELHDGSEFEYPEVTVTTFKTLSKATDIFEERYDFFKNNYDEDDFVDIDGYKFALVDQGEDEYIEFRIEEVKII